MGSISTVSYVTDRKDEALGLGSVAVENHIHRTVGTVARPKALGST